jgi:hypothetical protein
MSADRDHGHITVRSNVVLGPGRWDLVPGELLHALRRMDNATRLQHDEHMYYEPCSVCRRTIAEINLSGCDQCTHAPSPNAVEKARDAYRQRFEEARRREVDENAALHKDEDGARPSHPTNPPD